MERVVPTILDDADTRRQVRLDDLVERLLAVGLGLPSLDDPPTASRTRASGMGDKALGERINGVNSEISPA